MKKIFSIIVIILLGTITSQAAFLLLLHEKMKKHNQLIIRLTKMKEDKNYKDSTLYGPSNAELDMAVSYYDRGAYQTALPQLDRISKEGNANARYFLARCYYYGQGTEQNYSRAIDLLGQNHGITLADNANALETIQKVREILEQAEGAFPPDMECKIVVDRSKYISESMQEVSYTFFEAIFLVMIIMFLFFPFLYFRINSLFNFFQSNIADNISRIIFAFIIAALYLHTSFNDFIGSNAVVSFHLEAMTPNTS